MNKIDLSKAPPRSPYERVGNYAILARSIDKCRAYLQDTLGEYQFNCPIDRILFKFKEITPSDFMEIVKKASSDEEILFLFEKSGSPKSDAEKKEWSDSLIGRFDAVVMNDQNSF